MKNSSREREREEKNRLGIMSVPKVDGAMELTPRDAMDEAIKVTAVKKMKMGEVAETEENEVRLRF